MEKLTGVIITKNEEKRIGECLDSLSFCDEILVIDNNSSDETVAVARKKGATVHTYSSTDFADARNFALQKTDSLWILYVDADERISEILKQSVRSAVNSENVSAAGFLIKRKNFYLGNHEWPTIESLERLFKTKKLTKWQGKLHESPVVEGEIGELEGYLLHYTHRSLSEMVQKTLEWSKVEAQLRYEEQHPPVTWWRFPRVMVTAFVDSYIKQGGWKVGTVGLIESIYQAFSMFITYARLWELQNKLNGKHET